MSAAQPPDPHAELASMIGTRIAQQLWHTMPEIAEALGPKALEKASLTATMSFEYHPEKGFSVVIKFRSNIPVPEVSMKIGWLEKQLSLLPPDEIAEPTPPAPPPALPGLQAPVETGFQGRRPDPDEAGVGNA